MMTTRQMNQCRQMKAMLMSDDDKYNFDLFIKFCQILLNVNIFITMASFRQK